MKIWKLATLAALLLAAVTFMVIYRHPAAGGPTIGPADFLSGAEGPSSYGDVFAPPEMPEK